MDRFERRAAAPQRRAQLQRRELQPPARRGLRGKGGDSRSPDGGGARLVRSRSEGDLDDIELRRARHGHANDEIEEMQGDTVWMGGCPRDITEREIKQVFSKVGPILEISVKRTSRDTYCFISYGSFAHAREAIREFDQANLFGSSTIKVSLSARNYGGGKAKGNGKQRDNYDDYKGKGRDDYDDYKGKGDYDDYKAKGRDDYYEDYEDKRGGRGRAKSWQEEPDDRQSENGRDYRDWQEDNGRVRRNGRSRSAPRAPILRESRNNKRTVVEAAKAEKISRPLKRHKEHLVENNNTNTNGEKETEPARDKAKVIEVDKIPSPSPEASNENDSKQMVNKQRRGQVRLNLWQLPADFEEDELLEVASDYGAVLSHEFWQEKKQMCAMVEYETRDEAMGALEALHNRKMDGWHMLLKALVCD